ncbi:MAG TPA: Gx transporter family protein [Bacteroidota bacterium]|nr:Gx transporter family protein [Bacteroidota bacterium]
MSGVSAGWSVRRVTRIGFLTAAGTALFVLESLIPLPLPFLKVGLANISTLLALLIAGPADAVSVVFLRVLAGSLITGSFLGPAFILAMTAGLAAAAAMALLRTGAGRLFGPVGLSLAGATAHVSTQLALVMLLYVRNAAVAQVFPLLLLTALVGGLVVGLVAARLLRALPPETATGPRQWFLPGGMVTPGDVIAVVVLSAAAVLSFEAFPESRGATVLVEVAGRTVEKLDIREERTVTVRGAKGDLKIEVRDGRVRVADADCPNRICIRTGWRSSGGDVIVCVPNRTIVRILGSDPNVVGGITG